MNYVPDYLVKVIQSNKSSDDMEKSRLLLALQPEKEADVDYIYALAVSVISHSAPEQLVIDKCETFLPLVKTPECRRSLQSIRIWKYEDLKEHEKALALRLEQAEEHIGYSKSFYQDLAKAYKALNDNENALKYYEYYSKLENEDMDTDDYNEIAELYENAKDFKNSAKYHEKAAIWGSRFSAHDWQMTGRALALDGQIDEAMFNFKVSLKIEPENAYSHYFMGRCYQDKKDKYRALHHYTQALKIDPEFAAVHLNIGAMEFNEEGDIKAAIECFEKAIDVDTKGEFLLILYRNLRNLYKEILDFDKSEYYRGKIFELAGFSAEMGEFLDGMDENGLAFDGDDDDDDE